MTAHTVITKDPNPSSAKGLAATAPNASVKAVPVVTATNLFMTNLSERITNHLFPELGRAPVVETVTDDSDINGDSIPFSPRTWAADRRRERSALRSTWCSINRNDSLRGGFRDEQPQCVLEQTSCPIEFAQISPYMSAS